MSSKLIPTFVLVLLFIGLCELQTPDWCSLIQPKGTFDGMGIYHRWNSYEEGNADYVMFNKAKRQWKFKIEGNPRNLKEMEIQMIENSEESSVSDAIHRFGMFFKTGDWGSRGYPVYSFNCFVKTQRNTHNLLCEGWGFNNLNSWPTKLDETLTDFPSDSVLLKAWPRQTDFQHGGNVIVVVSKDRNHTLIMQMEGKTPFYGPKFDTKSCGPTRLKRCSIPKFIDQMDLNLFKKIDGVVDYNFADGSGYLLLFNIDGKPKYCFTPENKGLAQECNSSEKMQLLFESCFDSDPIPPPIHYSTPKTPAPDRKIWWYIVIIIVIILITAVISYILWKKKGVPAPVTSAGTTIITSEKSLESKVSAKSTLNSKANSSAKT